MLVLLFTELRSQMQKFSVILVHLPPLVVQIIVADQLSELEKERETLENDNKAMVQELERRKVQYNQAKFLTVHRGKRYGKRELPMKCKAWLSFVYFSHLFAARDQ